jgi:hypothetical protein
MKAISVHSIRSISPEQWMFSPALRLLIFVRRRVLLRGLAAVQADLAAAVFPAAVAFPAVDLAAEAEEAGSLYAYFANQVQKSDCHGIPPSSESSFPKSSDSLSRHALNPQEKQSS